MEMQTAITLLTIAVILLSTVMVVLLGVIIAILMKVQKLATNINNVTRNLADASAWLTPTKVLSTVLNIFKK